MNLLELDPGESCIILDSPGSICQSQQPLFRLNRSPCTAAPVSTNVNTGGCNAPIAVVGTHDVNSGTNFNGACRDSLTSLSVTGTRCCVDRNRTAVRRFGNDRIAIHARHSQCLAPALLPTSHRLSIIGASLAECQRLGAVRATLGACR